MPVPGLTSAVLPGETLKKTVGMQLKCRAGAAEGVQNLGVSQGKSV